jgi:hypothetical protein
MNLAQSLCHDADFSIVQESSHVAIASTDPPIPYFGTLLKVALDTGIVLAVYYCRCLSSNIRKLFLTLYTFVVNYVTIRKIVNEGICKLDYTFV